MSINVCKSKISTVDVLSSHDGPLKTNKRLNMSVQYITCMESDQPSSSIFPFLSYLGGYWRPLLENKRRIPDSSFSASASVEGHSSLDARTLSGSSWCAPAADGKHYIQADLGKLYWVYILLTYGDSTSSKWVIIFSFNYTKDYANWKTYKTVRNSDFI